MSATVSAVGQILAVGGLIDQGYAGYGAATMVAAFAEVAMIGGGFRALDNRYRRKHWKSLIGIAGAACAYAVTMNALHWYSAYGVTMAIMFAGASAIGWVLETSVQHIEAGDYEKRYATYKRELTEWRARYQHSAPDPSRVDTAPQDAPAPAAGHKPTQPSTSRSTSGRTQRKKATLEDAQRLCPPGSAPSEIGAALERAGFPRPHRNTLANWAQRRREAS